jgi:hypothetical protein
MKIKSFDQFFENFNNLSEIKALVREFVLGNEDSSRFDSNHSKKLIDLVSETDITAKSLEWTKSQGDFLYRGLKDDKPKTYIIGKNDLCISVESFTTDIKIAEEFGNGATIIEIPVDYIKDNILLSVDVVFKDLPKISKELLSKYNSIVDNDELEEEDLFRAMAFTQKEVLVKGPFKIPKEYIKKHSDFYNKIDEKKEKKRIISYLTNKGFKINQLGTSNFFNMLDPNFIFTKELEQKIRDSKTIEEFKNNTFEFSFNFQKGKLIMIINFPRYWKSLHESIEILGTDIDFLNIEKALKKLKLNLYEKK